MTEQITKGFRHSESMRHEENCEVFVVCAQIEQEIAELEEDEKKMFLEDLGLKESGLEKLIRASYHLLGLISYLTAGETGECVHGPLQREPKRHRQQERSIQISSVDLFVQRL